MSGTPPAPVAARPSPGPIPVVLAVPPAVPGVPPPTRGAGRRRIRPAHSFGTHVRAALLFLVLSVLVSGFAYPLFVTEVAQVIDPGAANGSLLHYPNGTVAGSSLIAQNTSAPYLFWARPSLTDYNTTLGAATPPGPTDPALGALLNETLSYMRAYGNFTVNASLPFWWVAPSGSSVDPDLTPEAVLVQIPRVSEATNLSIAYLTAFVNDHIQEPVIPFVGVPYVDVLSLDLDLLPLIGR
ncbi:MAG: potassium-transporting ATPase subunit C [Thermoplasmata archaeon]|nr:potassium-transporting ATPase subunit C [Thermoplasmata archaeon]